MVNQFRENRKYADIPAFGYIEGKKYEERPCCYGLILNDEGKVLVFYQGGKSYCLLPGGGLDGESMYIALSREFIEETGYTIEMTEKVYEAVQYTYSFRYQKDFCKIETFYSVKILSGDISLRLEKDGIPKWVSIEDAMNTLKEESHRNALSVFMKKTYNKN